MAKAVSVAPTSRSQLRHHASALYRFQRRAGLEPRVRVPAFLHILISSLLGISRRQIGTCITVRFSGSSIILANISIGFPEQFCVLVQLVAKKRLTKCLLDLALSGMRSLPAVETDCTHDFIDITHDTFNHYGCITVTGLFEQLCQRRFASVDFLFLWRLTLGLYHILC